MVRADVCTQSPLPWVQGGNMIQRLFCICVLVAFCFGCGGGGESGIPSERPTITADGYGVDAVIANATVEVFSWQGGAAGEKLGQGSTDAEGYYSITLQAQRQPILLQLSGGHYIEEASGRRVNLKADQRLYAVTYYSGEPITVMVTPITNLAAGLSSYMVANAGYNAENAITFATSAMTGIFGFNCLETYPINITEQESLTDHLSDGHLYGFFTAAISSWTAAISETNGQQAHSTYNSIYLAQLMHNDISADGALDGRGLNSRGEDISLFAGSVAMDSQVYRQMIGHHVIRAAGSDYNATGLSVEDVVEKAHGFSQRVNDIFGNEAPLALDTEGPAVYQTEPLGRYYTGTISYPFLIEDLVGVASIQVNLDENELDVDLPDQTSTNVVLNIDTAAYSDGEHILRVVSSDYLGNTSEHTLTLYTNNTGVTLTGITSAGLTRTNPFVLTGTYQESTGSSLTEIRVGDQIAAFSAADNTWSCSVVLQPGRNNFSIEASDNIGNIVQIATTVDYDQMRPLIYTGDDHGYHRFYIGGPEYDNTTSLILHDENPGDPLYFNYYTTSLGGVGVTIEDLKAAEIPFFRFSLSDPDDNGISTPTTEMTVNMIYRLSGAIRSEMQLYPISGSPDEFLIPLVTEYLGQFYNSSDEDVHSITVSTADAAGNTVSKTFTFKAHVASPKVTASSLNANSVISVYSWEQGTKGALVANGRTDQNGAVTLPVFAAATPVLIELTGGSYREFSTGGNISMDDRNLQAVANYNGEDLLVSVTPLTHAAAALASFEIGEGAQTRDAIQEANERISAIYGVDILATPIVDITDSTNATTVCSDPYKYTFILAGLSHWARNAAQANGTQSLDFYNSTLLAMRMASDIAYDGLLNNAESFGSVAIDPAVYQYGFGDAILAAVAGQLNATMLTTVDFISTTVSPDFTVGNNAFNVAFTNRADLYGRTVTVQRAVITNDDDQAILLRVEGSGSQNSVLHNYYDSRRRAMVKETISYQYRAQHTTINRKSAAPIRWTDWVPISSYETYQSGVWTPHPLPPVEESTYYTEIDVLPGNFVVDWHNLISEPQGDVFYMAIGRCSQVYSGGGGSSQSALGCAEGTVQWGDYRIGVDAYTYLYATQTSWSGNMPSNPASLSGRPTESDFSGEIATPKIQRYISHTYAYIDGPNVDVVDHSQTYQFGGTARILSSEGAPFPASNGYYIIPPMQTVVLLKELSLPTLPVYATGNPGPQWQTFDRSVEWSINKGVAYSLCQSVDVTVASQSPHYMTTQTESAVYTIQ